MYYSRMCIFCLSKGQVYSEEGLNIHYWRSCPMLTRCEACKQVVEISYLNSHLLSNYLFIYEVYTIRKNLSNLVFIYFFIFIDECDMRRNYIKCDICKQALYEGSFDEHRKEKKCSSMAKSKKKKTCEDKTIKLK